MKHTKYVTASALIGAPLLMLLADISFSIFEFPRHFWFASIAMFLSFFAYIGLIHGLYRLSNQTILALVGTLFAIFGTLAGETIMGLDRVAWAMYDLGMEDKISNTVHHPRVFSTSRQIGIAFPIGLLLLSISLYKAKAINMLSMIILMIGVLLFPVGRIIVGPEANVVGDFILLIIYGRLGINMWPRGSQNNL